MVGADRRAGPAPPRAAADLRRLQLARFGDNMRDVAVTEGDKVEAELRFGVSVNTYGRQRPGRARSTRCADADVDALVAEYADPYGVAPELRAGGERHESLRYAARIEAGLRDVPRRRAASAPSPRTSRTSAACASCPASPCSG